MHSAGELAGSPLKPDLNISARARLVEVVFHFSSLPSVWWKSHELHKGIFRTCHMSDLKKNNLSLDTGMMFETERTVRSFSYGSDC